MGLLDGLELGSGDRARGSDQPFLPSDRGHGFLLGVWTCQRGMLELGRQIGGRLGSRSRGHGVPCSSQNSGAREQAGSHPPASCPGYGAVIRAGRASTAAGGPFPLACLNLAPPQATRPLPHPLASVWGGGDDCEGPRIRKEGLLFSVVWENKYNEYRSEDGRLSGQLSGSS